MKNPREDAARTRKNLLDAAGRIFAEKGYRDATIAEICGQAGANVASVNYHFGNKENLYVEAWRRAFLDSLAAHPPDGGMGDDAPPEMRLRAHVTATIRRLADKNNREFMFVQREFANPTGLLEEVMKKAIHPLQKRTEGLVRELLGPGCSDADVRFCEISVISQCINPIIVKRKHEGSNAGRGGPPVIRDTDAYADHVAAFSLAGLRAVRMRIEAKGPERQHVKKGRKATSREDE